LANLVEALLSINQGFDVLAGAIILLAFASHTAAVRTLDYAVNFIWAFGMLRGAFAGSVTVLHSFPFLYDGVKNSPTVRAIAGIEQWVELSRDSETIIATRIIFKDSITAYREC
jgi:hypothetical protein